MNNLVVTATEFKAKCLELIDEVSAKGGTITVTKRGRSIATVEPVQPVRKRPFKSTMGSLKGKFEITDELLNCGLSDDWNVPRKK